MCLSNTSTLIDTSILESFPPDSDQQQALITAIQNFTGGRVLMPHWLTIETFCMLSLLIYIICILFGNVLIYSLSSKGITLFFGGFLKAVMQVIQMVHTVQLSSERWL